LHVYFAKVVTYLLWCGFRVTVYLEPLTEKEGSIRKDANLSKANEQFYRRITWGEINSMNEAEPSEARKDLGQVQWALDFTDEEKSMTDLDARIHRDLELSLYSQLPFGEFKLGIREAMRPRMEAGLADMETFPAMTLADAAFHETLVMSSKGPLRDAVAILCGKDRKKLIDTCRLALAKTQNTSPPPLVMRTLLDLDGKQGFNDQATLPVWPGLDEHLLNQRLRKAMLRVPLKVLLEYANIYLSSNNTVLKELLDASASDVIPEKLRTKVADALTETLKSYVVTEHKIMSGFAQPVKWIDSVDHVLSIGDALSGPHRLGVSDRSGIQAAVHNKRKILAAIIKLDSAKEKELAYSANLSRLLHVSPSSVKKYIEELKDSGLIESREKGGKQKTVYYPCAKESIVMEIDLRSFANKYIDEADLAVLRSVDKKNLLV
jgi:DNA-binding transcriptional ArsR family regulator